MANYVKDLKLTADLDELYKKPTDQLSATLSDYIQHNKIEREVEQFSYNPVASDAVYNEISSLNDTITKKIENCLSQIKECRDLINLYHKDAKWSVDNIDAIDQCISKALEIVTNV